VDVESDEAHCGRCGRSCPVGERCQSGVCSCPLGSLAIENVAPPNAATNVSAAGLVSATFSCTLDRALARRENARLYGYASGYVPSSFPTPDSANKLWLDPLPRPGLVAPYFAGERITAWLGRQLAGPYLWQYTVAVSPKSPGTFQKGIQDLSALTSASNSVLGDIDGDGDLDMLARGESSVVVVSFNLGQGTFSEPEVLKTQGNPVLGDVDADGDLDLSAGGWLLRNDGKGHFSDGQEHANCNAMGDLDGDGDLDCVSNNGLAPSGVVLLNDGTGAFVAGSSAPFGFQCEIADLDGDADLDVLCNAPVVEAGRVFLNDGNAVFTRTEQLLGDVWPRSIALGDVDADGDIDAVMAQWAGPNRSAPNIVWLNDGKGRFSEGGNLGEDSTDIDLGDVDGDGDLDAVVSHAGPYLTGPYNPTRIFLNDGAGHFTHDGRTLGDPAFHSFALGDLDGDGDLDAFVYHALVDRRRKSYCAVWFNGASQ
jgi:hypothetical protein